MTITKFLKHAYDKIYVKNVDPEGQLRIFRCHQVGPEPYNLFSTKKIWKMTGHTKKSSKTITICTFLMTKIQISVDCKTDIKSMDPEGR